MRAFDLLQSDWMVNSFLNSSRVHGYSKGVATEIRIRICMQDYVQKSDTKLLLFSTSRTKQMYNKQAFILVCENWDRY